MPTVFLQCQIYLSQIEKFKKDWDENYGKILDMERKFNLFDHGNLRNCQIELEIPDNRKILSLEDIDELYSIRHNEK